VGRHALGVDGFAAFKKILAPPASSVAGDRQMPTDGNSIGASALADYPNVYNIERDPHEDLFVRGLFGWVPRPALKVVEDYLETVKRNIPMRPR
jgi:hypothetical protein